MTRWTHLLRQHASRGLADLAVAGHRSPEKVGVLVVMILIALGFASRPVSVDAQLLALLPRTLQSVQALEDAEKVFGGGGYLVVALLGEDLATLKDLADEIAEVLAELPEIRYVRHRRHLPFFQDRALYYLDLRDLTRLRGDIERTVNLHRLRRNPFYLDLGTPQPSRDFDDLRLKYANLLGLTELATTQAGDYFVDRSEPAVFLFAKPSKPSSDLDFSRKLVQRVEALLAAKVSQAQALNWSAGLSGRYTKRVEQQDATQADLKRASALAVLLVLGLLFAHFRRWLVVLVLLLPLGVGLFATFVAAGLLWEKLNILTAFVGVLLLGLGIDHGIHLLCRFQHECTQTASSIEAIRVTYSQTGPTVVAAAATTAIGFAGLNLSELRAVEEFGLLAALGTGCVAAAYLLCLPPLLRLPGLSRGAPSIATRAGEGGSGRDGGQPPASSSLPWVKTGGTLLLSVLALLGWEKARFDFSFDSLQNRELPSYPLNEMANAALGHSQVPVVVPTQTLSQERAVAGALRARAHDAGASGIDRIWALSDLVPAEQAAKHELLRQMEAILAPFSARQVPREHRGLCRTLKRMVQQRPFALHDLPRGIQQELTGMQSDQGFGVVLIAANSSLDNADGILAFAREVRSVVQTIRPRVTPAGEAFLLADLVTTLRRDAPLVLGATLAGIALCAFFLIGSWRWAILALLPAFLTLVGTVGLMPWMNVNLNYLSMVGLPVVMGLGVDGGLHLVWRLRTQGPSGRVSQDTTRAICLALATTGLGFGSLWVTHNPGLSSLGSVVLLGLAINLLATVVILPSLLAGFPEMRNG